MMNVFLQEQQQPLEPSSSNWLLLIRLLHSFKMQYYSN